MRDMATEHTGIKLEVFIAAGGGDCIDVYRHPTHTAMDCPDRVLGDGFVLGVLGR